MSHARKVLLISLVAGATLWGCSKPKVAPVLLDSIQKGNVAGAEAALKAGASPNTVKDGWTPLHVILDVSQTGDVDDAARIQIVDLLLKAGADPNKKGGAGTTGLTPLHFSAVYGPIPAVESLLKGGADANALDEIGRGPLTYAIQIGKLEVVRLLLSYGADPNAASNKAVSTRGMTPLHLAARGKPTAKPGSAVRYEAFPEQVEMIKALLAKGADPTLRDAEGRTALDLAQTNGHQQVVETLRMGK